MTSDDEMRQFVADLYDGPRWKRRVKKMPSTQIYMIYHSKQALAEGEEEQEVIESQQLQFDFEETR